MLDHKQTSYDCSQWYDCYQNDEPNGDYDWIMIMRIVIICISATALITNIVVIISKKQYKFNTIRLFLFVQIFYVISLLSVTPHSSSFNLDQTEQPCQGKFPMFMECLIQSGDEYKCAIQGFVNLTCYSISYWFAVCITLYISLVLQNNHRMFMKKKGPLIFAVIVAIIIWYLIPFILTFFQDVPFSFGPTGYWFEGKSYFLYAGIVNREQSQGAKFLVAFWMLVLPVSLFIYHIWLLWRNHKYIRRLTQLDELNPRQYFLIRSGKLSFWIFAIQIFNVAKLILSFPVSKDTAALAWLLFVLNTIFDLLAVLLILMYLKVYYREGRNLQQDSQIMNRSLASSFATLTSSII